MNEKIIQFLNNNQLSIADIEKTLGILGAYKIDYGDLYFQQTEHESWGLEESKVKSSSFSLNGGVGIRAIIGEQTGFAYADEISLQSMLLSAKSAREISKKGKSANLALKSLSNNPPVYTQQNPLAVLDSKEKVRLLQQIDTYVRKKNNNVTNVFANLAGSFETILIAGTDGTFASDIRPLVRLNITVIVEKNNKKEQGTAGIGGRYLLSDFNEQKNQQLADEALRQALVNLEAQSAPAGTMDVVLGPGWPGVLLHEAVGHGLEADFNRKQTSVYSNMIGEMVASPLCTVIDDGSLINRRGSLQVDDEGTPTRENILIENGILKSYMQDKLNAKLMGKTTTGNGRRESYAYLPMPRMTNTFMRNGKSTQQEMIKAVQNGILAVNFSGGQVDITSGKFVFSTSEAYKISNGKICYPIKNATLIGNGIEVMQNITMIGDDLKLDNGVGICGKSGQSVPVGVGQPSLLVKDLIVGGTDK